METQPEDLEKVYARIKAAGGRAAFVERRLEELGLAVERVPTENMGKKALAEYRARNTCSDI